ncbi:MAG TPA: rhodanese-like domain-containing protein [Candidatus Methylomirabilis sp.]|nr:rhodanese-like domain-containing protein [Candidatus Methylomirabilis sp.]
MTEWKKIFRWVGIAAAGCSFLFRPSFVGAQGEGGGYANLSPSEARDLIGKRSGDPGFVLLDVRTPKEFEEERIEGSVLVDYQASDFRKKIAGFDREKTYLVYCRSGNRTVGALKAMREQGFRDLHHLAGGIRKWKEAGFPTVK